MKDNLCLFFSNILGKLFCFGYCWENQSKIERLFERSADKMDGDLDIVKITRNMRNFKILLKNYCLDDKIKFEIAHSNKNCIDVDTTDSNASLDEDEKDIIAQIEAEVAEKYRKRKERKLSTNPLAQSRVSSINGSKQKILVPELELNSSSVEPLTKPDSNA